MRRWAWPWRAGLAVLIVCFVALPLANYHWTLFGLRPYDPATGADPEYISAPVGAVTAWITYETWWLFPNWLDAVVAAAAAIGLFILLGGHRACSPRQTRCGSCRSILRGLSEPRCPHCDTPL